MHERARYTRLLWSSGLDLMILPALIAPCAPLAIAAASCCQVLTGVSMLAAASCHRAVALAPGPGVHVRVCAIVHLHPALNCFPAVESCEDGHGTTKPSAPVYSATKSPGLMGSRANMPKPATVLFPSLRQGASAYSTGVRQQAAGCSCRPCMRTEWLGRNSVERR